MSVVSLISGSINIPTSSESNFRLNYSLQPPHTAARLPHLTIVIVKTSVSFKKGQICDSSSHTGRLQSVIVHIRCFGPHYKMCNFICCCDHLFLGGKFFQMFISCISFRIVLSKTGWDLPSFTGLQQFLWGIIIDFHQQSVTLVFWFSCIGNFFRT